MSWLGARGGGMIEVMHTGRLVIRRFSAADLANLMAYQTRPETLQYEPVEPMTEERAVDYLAKQADPEHPACGPAGGWLSFAVQHNGDARVIGEVGIFFEPEPKSEGAIGWMFHPDFCGRGYATEAAQALLRYAFETRRLHRLTSGCDTQNTASWRLMERLGMRREGHFLQSRRLRGEWRDGYSYALLRDEWLNRQTEAPSAGLSPE